MLDIVKIINFIKRLEPNRLISIVIITNGSLINEFNIKEMLISEMIKSFQFTFDGLPYYHDRVKGKKGAFFSAINGINYLIKSNFKGTINIRINISEQNKNSIKELLSLLKSKFISLNKLLFYPAFINNKNNTVENNYCIQTDNAYLINGIFYKNCTELRINYLIYLTPLLINCSYLRENSFTIAPNLKLYKCIDEQINDDNSVGILKDGKIKLNNFTNEGRIKHFNKITESFLTKKECKNCSWLPICRTGCPLEINNNSNNCRKFMQYRLINYIKYRNVRK